MVPICCGDGAIFSDNVMVGHNEGVIVIPVHLADKIADEAINLTLNENFVTKSALAGQPIIGLYPLAIEPNITEFGLWKKHKDRSTRVE